jgi:predicted nucleic acid-binding protein
MKLVDTGCWIHAMSRKGDSEIGKIMTILVESGQAAWCAPVRLELWAGIGAGSERAVLRMFEQTIPELPINDDIWRMACELADLGRAVGKTFPSNDLLIAACAIFYEVELEQADEHFDEIFQLKKN